MSSDTLQRSLHVGKNIRRSAPSRCNRNIPSSERRRTAAASKMLLTMAAGSLFGCLGIERYPRSSGIRRVKISSLYVSRAARGRSGPTTRSWENPTMA